MNNYSFGSLKDHELAAEVDAHLKSNRRDTAIVLAKLGEFDARCMYEPAGYSSMRSYCVEKYGMDEDETHRVIRVARTAHLFPAIFPARADSRLTQTAVLILTPHLTSETPAEVAANLLASTANMTKTQIMRLLADRAAPLAVPSAFDYMPAVVTVTSESKRLTLESPAVPSTTPNPTEVKAPPCLRGRVTPLSHGYCELSATLHDEATQALEDTRALLGHSLPSGSIPLVIKRALVLLARELRRKKFAQVDKPRAPKRKADGPRIPAHVRHAVVERDGETCALVSADGHRCNSRERVEFDHIVPLAQESESTVENVRLHCRTHNQYRAKQLFGAGFMQEKVDAAKQRAAQRRANKVKPAEIAAAEAELIPILLRLGYNQPLAKRGASVCTSMLGASLAARVRAALRELALPCVKIPAPIQCSWSISAGAS